MTNRTRERGEGFRAAQIQQRRADRGDERIAELRRELMHAQRELKAARDGEQTLAQRHAEHVRTIHELRQALSARDARLHELEAAERQRQWDAAHRLGFFARLRARIVGDTSC